MPIVPCSCGQMLKIPDAGGRSTCPGCSQIHGVPGDAATQPVASSVLLNIAPVAVPPLTLPSHDDEPWLAKTFEFIAEIGILFWLVATLVVVVNHSQEPGFPAMTIIVGLLAATLHYLAFYSSLAKHLSLTHPIRESSADLAARLRTKP
jgi:hypothetical protein